MRRDQAKAADFARRHGATRWYSDIESLLADLEVNAVYVASPHGLQLTHVTQAARAGRIVLREEPMGTGTDEARRSVDVDACKTYGVPLTVAYYRRFWPITRAIQQLLATGVIGLVVRARVHLADHFAGDPQRPWLTSHTQAGGGALANAGSHWVELVRFLLGEVVDMMAYCSSEVGGFEVDDTAVVQMRTATGVFVSFASTWQSQTPINEVDLIGATGRILPGPLSAGKLVLQQGTAEPETMQYSRTGVVHRELLGELIPHLLAGQPSQVSGEEAVAVWRIMEAAYHSNAEGRRVRVG
jgi:predicted dehydrogenase